MSFIRMAMRFEKPYPLIKDIIRLHSTPFLFDPVNLLKSIGHVFLILYFITDHPMFFHRLGYLTYSAKFADDLDYVNNVFWLLNTLMVMLVDAIEIIMWRQRSTWKVTNALINASDLPIIFFFMNVEQFGPVLAGACGALASLAVLWRI